ncbi:patatin-like phospholipase family protein [Thalassotalea ganghwensis]
MESYHESYSQAITEQEKAWIKQRRQQAGLLTDENENPIGLAFSGGGIRSATFNLGVLQALEKHDQLKKFDYLSSVSGGSYIATSFTWFKSRLPNIFPFGKSRQDHDKIGGAILAWLRSHSSFLAPGNGINKITLLSAILTGSLVNLIIMLPMLVLFMYILALSIPNFSIELPWYRLSTSNGFALLQLAAQGLMIGSAGIMLLTAFSTVFQSPIGQRRTENLRRLLGNMITASIVLGFIGYIPNYHQWLNELSQWLVHTSATIAALGILLMSIAIHLNQRSSGQSIVVNIVTEFSLLLLCLGVVIICYHLTLEWEQIPNLMYISLLLSLILALTCNINNVSMHGYYRNRLKAAFIPCKVRENQSNNHILSTWQEAQRFALSSISITSSPFPIINSNIELTDSKEPKYYNRAGDSFSFTPLYCGANSTGFIKSDEYLEGQHDLASICAISGAAVATNTAYTRSSTLNFLMSLFNIRLGCWLRNPQTKAYGRIVNRPLWYQLMFRDMFGRGLNEHQKSIHLSDGGHFENLGVYELIRRQCKTILCCDAAADPNYLYQDLAKLITLVRVDFGVKISIDVSHIHAGNITTNKPWAEGEITYKDGTKGRFIYLKATMVEGLNQDLNSYKKLNPSFPHQSTANQFFNEWQFEAYRELGFQLTNDLICNTEIK